MHSFGWKKKIRTKTQASVFDDAESDEDIDSSIDWLTATKRPKLLVLEDKESKSRRLCLEGITLAEQERWWEAIGKWNNSIAIKPDNCSVLDMLSQAYMQVAEIYAAVSCASKCVQTAPNWWPGFQTLGRAQLGIGEVSMAIKSFSRAIRLHPSNEELWKDDLMWAIDLRKKQVDMEYESAERAQQRAEDASLILREIKEFETDFPSSNALETSSQGINSRGNPPTRTSCSSKGFASTCRDGEKDGPVDSSSPLNNSDSRGLIKGQLIRYRR